ncbi:hypothetical protein DQ04_01311070 [Trypanosoma grayi]|uniref:hypothetical protein n=1 Tax=Trypanosoma grayi TaxID=71804 RepID=UPI0004F48191|nr:hypothetical protein DQ04_01311070 [Trypanosoma grayi]KEG12948.1 hypothetical protein DQ04_01311070 [Trypanosoma grayi]
MSAPPPPPQQQQQEQYHHHTANTTLPHGSDATDAHDPVGGNHICHDTVSEPHNALRRPQAEVAGNVPDGQHATGGDGEVSFGDFFFNNLPPGDGDDAMPSSAFDGFCFDNICDNGEWPSSGIEMCDTTRDGDTCGENRGVTPSFDFLLPDDAATATAAVGSTTTKDELDFDLTMAHSTDAVVSANTNITSVAAVADAKEQQNSTTCEASDVSMDIAALSSVNNSAAAKDVTGAGGSNNSVALDGGSIAHESLKGVAAPLVSPRLSLGAKDISLLSGGSAATATTATSRVPRDGVEELLRRAERILREANEAEAVRDVADVPAADGRPSSDSIHQPDAFFSAQASHWLRRGAEVQESVLATVTDLQLRLTQTVRLFGAHSGLSSALGPKYAATPVVLTLPLVLPLLESLLAEE